MPDGTRLDTSSFVHDYDEEFFEAGGLVNLDCWLNINALFLPKVNAPMRLRSPISRPSNIVCIDSNFCDHAKESRMEIPKEPVIFLKATTSLVGPNDNLVIPKIGGEIDWEVERGVVLGKKGNYIAR